MTKFHQKDIAECCCTARFSQDTDSHSILIHGKVVYYYLYHQNSPTILSLSLDHTPSTTSLNQSLDFFILKFKMGFSISSVLLNFCRLHIITALLEASPSHILDTYGTYM